MDLPQNQNNFDEIWTDIHKTITALITSRSVHRTAWNKRVSDVYSVSTNIRQRLGSRLYQEIRTFLESYVGEVYQVVYLSGEDNMLMEYERFWRPYHASVPYLDNLFSYLNSQVIRKHKFSQVDINYPLYGINCDDNMVDIGELAMDTWQRIMVDAKTETLKTCLLQEIDKDRLGQSSVNQRSISCVISSFVELLHFKIDDDLKLYETVFEVPFFITSTRYFIQMSQRFRDESDCSEFMVKVIRFINSEVLRSRKFLHPESFNKVLFNCRQYLLVHNVSFINSNCRDMVQREKWNDLSNMYQLLNPTSFPLEDSLEMLVTEFEDHLKDIGLAVMQSLQGDDLANQFVEAMLEFRSKYNENIKIVFVNNAQFHDALDKACTAAINFKRHPKASCRSPELLAKYCDDLLKKTAKGLTENEMEDRLNDLIQLFNYISDKDIFQMFYARGMAKRLIFGHFQSMDLEEAMINRLKQVCGYEYTSKLHRMFTDMVISRDLNAKFSSFLNVDFDRQLAHGFYINVLAAGSWPISQTNLPSFSLPQELEKSVGMFELFYNEQFSGRKLTWMYNLSLVELRFGFCKRPYLVTMEMYLMGVLLCFNHADILNYRDIRDSCQLPNKELLKQLQLLVETKMLNSDLPVTDSSVFKLNLKFSNKRTKFKVLPIAPPLEIVQEVVQTHVSVEEDRRMFMQASIVRIMKARKEMGHTALVQEVINQARSRFVPRVTTIKKCIENLLEKQYIANSEKTPGNYQYVA